MTETEYKKIKRSKKIEDCVIWWIKVALFGVLLGGILFSCASNAAAYRRPQPYVQRHVVVNHYHHDNYVPYVMAGVVLGVVIYSITQTRCDSGIVCTKF